MSKKVKLALVTGLVSSVFALVLGASTASAYTTSSNWYQKTWYMNKSETYQIAWVNPSPSTALQGITGIWPQLRVALSVYSYSFKWIAQQARSRNGCISIVWIYVNLPYPEMYWGPSCF